MFFSPDGAFVAYDLRASDTSEQRDVFVMSVDGGADIPAVVHSASDVVVGWSPDGRSLLFASDRAGSMALWALPFANGKPQGAPVFLKELGSPVVTSLGLTRSGSLLYAVALGGSHIDVASIDFETGKVLVPPKQMAEPYVLDDEWPDWSRDGNDIVYVSGARNHFALVIRSVETGQARPLPLQMATVGRPRWSPDGSILVQGSDSRGRQGIYKLDSQSGDLSPVVISNPARTQCSFPCRRMGSCCSIAANPATRLELDRQSSNGT